MEKAINMPTPAMRKRVRRPTRSTRKAQPRETSQHQIVRPPLMAAWFDGLHVVRMQKAYRPEWVWLYTHFVIPIVVKTDAR
jgi:hypothetical protein